MRIIDLEQGSSEWLKFKAGKVSGTSLAQAVGTPRVQETLLNRLIAERMTEVVNIEINSEAVQRGTALEPVALNAMRDKTSLPFETVGMIAPDYEGFAVSPDAILKEGSEIVSGLEIKCPDSKKHIEYLRAGIIPKEYRHQVLSPFLCSKSITSWHFASFDDRNYELPLFTTVINRADVEDEIAEIQRKLASFLDLLDKEYFNLTF